MSENHKLAGLHVHSERSFLDGYSGLSDIAQRAKDLGQTAVALTDHQEVNGHFQFQSECLDRGIKPLFGCEGYLVNDVAETRREKMRENSHITLIAKNNEGLSNLWAWTSEAYEKNFYYRALQDWEGARKYSKGLYASDGCLLSFMARAITAGDDDRCHQLMGRYLDVFGENFYMELHTFQFINPTTQEHYDLNKQMTMVNQGKVALAQQYGVPLVVVNDAHYTRPEDWENHALVWAMNTRGNLDQTGEGRTAAWMMSEEEAIHWMGNHGISRSITEEAIRNTTTIADSCDVEIKSDLRMPRLTDSDKDDLNLFLRHLDEGFKRKVEEKGLNVDLYHRRMENEIKTITDKGFAGYFNVVADYTKWAKTEAKMMMGPSRGSAGGSLVAYLMDITEIDPLRYDLDFDRFINPDRKDFPDVDLDFPRSRRPEVKRYLQAKYGEDHVCGIGSLSTLQPRGVLKDLSRAMEIPYEDSRSMAKIIEQVHDIDTANVDVSWTDVLEGSGSELEPWAKKYPELFEKMGEMVGLVRQSGTHAAGTLVSNRPLLGDIPTRGSGEKKVSAFTGTEVEKLGFIKFDLLGIRHLDTLQVAKELIKERHGVDLDYYHFDDKQFADPEIWKMFEDGHVNGIFQAEAQAMAKVGQQLKPKSERDLSILYAVNRPGVVRAGLLQPFLRRWNGEEEVSFDHPMMEDVVGQTAGILIFQEQILKTVKKLAGFSASEADDVRKIMGKMLYSKMKEKKVEFVDRTLQNEEFVSKTPKDTTPRKCAEKIWESIEASGIYVFNESHSVAYATLSAWEVWTKHYYYPEFVTALMMTDGGKINTHIRDARRKGIEILPPDVNESGRKFTLVDDKKIRFGLDTIAYVGESAVTEILKHRPYTSLEDFCKRTSGRTVNKKVVTNLIKIGAFDSLGERSDVLQEYYDMRKITDTVPDYTDEDVVYQTEVELVGNYILRDPMEKYEGMIERVCLGSPKELETLDVGARARIGGKLTKIKTHITRGKKEMAFIEITWNEEVFSITVFPQAWEANKPLFQEGKPVAVLAEKLEKGQHLLHLERLDYLIK